jgi:peptidyl-prolyl cis-trans isomerase D
VATLSEGKLSAPIQGNNGVYLAKVTTISNSSNTDLKGEKSRLAQAMNYRTGGQVFQSLKKEVDIVDKRSKFY